MRGPGAGRVPAGGVVRVAAHVVVWAVLAVALTLLLLGSSSRTTTLVGHRAVVEPDLGGDVVVRTGPFLPDLRLPAQGPVGATITLGSTDATSVDELVQRYALLATQPDVPRTQVADAVGSMVVSAALRGAGLALLPVVGSALLGRVRRRELLRRARGPRGLAAGAVAGAVAVAVWQPWSVAAPPEPATRWQRVQDVVGPGVVVPAVARDLELSDDGLVSQTRRLVESAVDTYDKSRAFYDAAVADAAGLDLRVPGEDETVVVLVSDRHDNIGMDAVARAIGDRAGATAVMDAGDDTSTGSPWEAFSLDSVQAAFADLDERWAVPGNHDNGTFVGSYLADHGWDVLDGEVVDGPGGSRLLGAADPRASGLGSWRDETGLGFGEVGTRLADAACAADAAGDRVATLLVHDANLGREALDRGCTDLVVGGHTHVRSGPTARGDGWTYTTGTTGGAAYAFALGSKPRREAETSLVTYRDGRPVGVQSVLLQTDGSLTVVPWVELTYGTTGSPAEVSSNASGSAAAEVSASSGRSTSTAE